MKHVYVLIGLVVLCMGCMPSKKPVAVEEVEADTMNVNRSFYPPIPVCSINLNNYVFVDTMGRAPMNEQVTVYDKQGRLLAVAARPSEDTYFRYFKYLYDRKGNHIGFSTLKEDPLDYPFASTSALPFNDQTYAINSLYHDLVERKYNDSHVERYKFVWDAQGNIIRVYDPITHKKLDVSEGKRMVYRIEEGKYFWMSDLQGGDYYLMFYIVSNDSTQVSSDTMVYEGYEPYVEMDW